MSDSKIEAHKELSTLMRRNRIILKAKTTLELRYKQNRVRISELKKRLSRNGKRTESRWTGAYACLARALEEFNREEFTSADLYELVGTQVTRKEITELMWHFKRKGVIEVVSPGSGKRVVVYRKV